MAVLYDVSMEDGRKEKVTLNLGALMELSRKDKPLVDRYFELYRKFEGKKDTGTELDIAELIYIAYRAAHVKEDDYMTMEDFLYQLSDDRVAMANVFQQLFGTAKKKDSQRPSGKPHRR